jgi:hypothetical protein
VATNAQDINGKKARLVYNTTKISLWQLWYIQNEQSCCIRYTNMCWRGVPKHFHGEYQHFCVFKKNGVREFFIFCWWLVYVVNSTI